MKPATTVFTYAMLISNTTQSEIPEKRPYGGILATLLILLANIAVFAYSNFTDIDPVLFDRLVLSPYNLLIDKNFACIISSGFMHSGLGHLFFNMLGVFIFGTIVERRFGFFKTIFIYFAALIMSMLFAVVIYFFLLDKNVALMGASGALMGLIATAMLSDPFLITYETLFPVPVMIKGWMFIYADMKGFLGGETDGISHLSHLLGFLSIAVIMYFLDTQDKRVLIKGLLMNIFSFIVFLFLMQHFEGTKLVGILRERVMK